MTDREKVIKALQQCVGYEDADNKYTCIYDGDTNPNCPYGGTGDYEVSCMTKMMQDALALLKEQREAIPIDWLMRYAQLPTEFAIAEWRRPKKESMIKAAKSLDKPMSFDDALKFVDRSEVR